MGRFAHVVDCGLVAQHAAALAGGLPTDDLPPHTSLLPFTAEQEAQADADAAQGALDRVALTAAAEQRTADLAALATSADPAHQALARLLGA